MEERTAPSAPTSARGLVVAIDGPSGSGKSTVSRVVASSLGLRYLDTGSMYRALTWRVLREAIAPDDATAVAALAERVAIEVGTDPAAPWVAVDGVTLGERVRSSEVAAAVSAVSAVPPVRRLLVDQQRRLIGTGGIVVEGRDIGTVVAPEAGVKVFLTAASGVRAERRTAQRQAPAPLADVQRAMERRDRLDSGRTVSPLIRAKDAVEVDTTERGVDEVVEVVLALCTRAGGRVGATP